MGAGAGGYVTITPQMLLSEFGVAAGHLHIASASCPSRACLSPTYLARRALLRRHRQGRSGGRRPPGRPRARLGSEGAKPRDVAKCSTCSRGSLPPARSRALACRRTRPSPRNCRTGSAAPGSASPVALAPTACSCPGPWPISPASSGTQSRRRGSRSQVTPIVMAFGIDCFVDHADLCPRSWRTDRRVGRHERHRAIPVTRSIMTRHRRGALAWIVPGAGHPAARLRDDPEAQGSFRVDMELCRDVSAA